MHAPDDEHRETPAEEVASALTHGLGALLAAAALAVLVTLAAIRGDAWRVVSFAIYGATLVILYLASTLLHAVRHPNWEKILHHLDYSAIFLLIAGTYTPYMLVNLRGPWGWTLFGIAWGIAAAGIVLRLTLGHRYRRVYLAMYLGMGWMMIVAIKPLMAKLEPMGLVWIAIGGLFYTVGVVFYLWRRLPYNHMIWHLFVLGGSISHFFGILFYVLPMPPT